MTDVLARPWLATPAYAAYVEAQRAKTVQYRHKHLPRIERWMGLIVSHCPELLEQGGDVLCVGCRNLHELDVWHELGCHPTGIDLVQMVPGVLPMDMHAMTFNREGFDVVFGSHVLEHAYDLRRALLEWRRVTKSGGVWIIEMPVRFSTSAVDRIDVGDLEGLRRYFPCPVTELYAVDTGTVIRFIGRLDD